MLITPAADLATITESAMVEVPLDASALPARAPAEAWAHLALYRARPDAMSVARAQPASGFAAAATGISLAPVYGQAAWLGETIPVHGGAHLLRSADLAERAARDLPAGEALLLRGGPDVAAVRGLRGVARRPGGWPGQTTDHGGDRLVARGQRRTPAAAMGTPATIRSPRA
jgi:hypothetical protein